MMTGHRTDAEADELFGQTQPGDSLTALAQAEVIVEATATAIPSDVDSHLENTIGTITANEESP